MFNATYRGIAMLTRRLLFVVLALSAIVPAVPALAAGDVVVFAAASLKNALDDAVTGYKTATGKTVTVSYGGSSALAKQIEAAAPADIFFSADLAWMKDLHDKNLTVPATEKSLLGNEIVLVAPKDSTAAITVAPGFDLAGLLGSDGHLAMANVDSVPAGKYGKAALTKLGVWDAVSSKVVQADDVRAALAFVTSGEAPAGIVYATDAAAEPGVKVIATFPADSHPPIVYPVALIAASTNPDAKAFLDYIESDAAKPAFTKQGFTFVTPAM
jgi:molybdate transport system substrate-binding protein